MAKTRSFDDVLATASRVRTRRGLTRSTRVAKNIWCDLASNDYVGLSKDARVLGAGRKALEAYGASARASRVVSGTLPVHAETEAALAQLTQMPSGLLFSSGYMANMAVIAALGRANTRVLLDAHVHASLHDAIRLCLADVDYFDHQNHDHLIELLNRDSGKPTLIVVEGVYSVLGDAADLLALHAIAQRYDAWVLVDESHSLGVLGQGRGACVRAGIAGAQNLIVTASLGKAMGSAGGVVLCSEEVRDYLVNTSRTFIFDTALSPVNAAAAAASARIVSEEGTLLTQKLFDHAQSMSAALGIALSAGAVQSVPIGSGAAHAARITSHLYNKGIAVGCFRPPSVPDGISRLRLTASAGVTSDDLRQALQEISQCLTDCSEQEQP